MIAPLPPAGCKVYTPDSLADALVNQLMEDSACDWLEPSVGRGAFVQALSKRGVPPDRITAVDLDRVPGPVDYGAMVIRGVDFLEWGATQPRKFDRIVANPPYVAIPKLTTKLKRPAIAALRRLQDAPTAAANYWASFLIISMSLLRRHGHLGFVLPAAWDYADYSAPIREEILRNFSTVIVHRCYKPLFPEVQEGVVVLLAKGYGAKCSRLIRRDYPDGPALLAGLQAESSLPPANQTPTKESSHRLERVNLGDLFDIRLGGVTGDSGYFLLSESRRRELGLPERVCTPVLTKSNQLLYSSVSKADWMNLKHDDKRVWLFSPPPDALKFKSVRAYLRLTVAKGGCDRTAYKIANRSPWYTVPLPENIDGFISGMAKRGPWIAWRSMRGLAATNTLYVVSCKERMSPGEKCAWAISLLSSRSRLAASALGRRYADGLIKLEPGDLKQIPLLRPVSTRCAKENYEKIVELLIDGEYAKAEARANALCVTPAPGKGQLTLRSKARLPNL